MLNLTHRDKPDTLEYFGNVSCDRRVFFDKRKVLNIVKFEEGLALTCRDLSITALTCGLEIGGLYIGDISKYGGSKESRELILEYLLKEAGPKREYMLSQKGRYASESGYSLDKNNVLIPMRDAGIANEFLDSFIDYREHNKAAKDMIKKVAERFEDTEVPGISSLSYYWSRALTGRLYTNNDNVQNIAKLYLPALTGPNDDYYLVWGDFDQIDLRVAYYTVISESEEDDKLFAQYDDKYEAIARIIDRKLGREFNLENFKDNRKKYKTGILARCYGQSLQRLVRTVGDKDFARMLDNYFKSNKRYSKWYDTVCALVDCYDSLSVYTYFGNECFVTLDDCSTSDQKVDRILNCPIQGTSNDIIMHMVNKTVSAFRSAGFGEDKFRVYMIRHDEPIFMIHKDALPYLHLIRDNTIIQVDDWGPLTMSLEIGKYYTENQYDDFKDMFGNSDISAGRKVIARQTVYDPFVDESASDSEVRNMLKYVKDSVLTASLYIGEELHVIDLTKNVKYQIHNELALYAKSKGMSSITFNVQEGNPIELRNIFIDDIYMYFREVKGM